MALFEYKGLDATGKSTRGMVEAETVKAARARLKRSGLLITDIAEKTSGGKSGGGGGGRANANPASSSSSLFGGIKLKDVSLFTRQFSSLLKANIPVVDALSALVEQVDNEKLKMVLSVIRQDINEGSSLAKALSKHPKIFNLVFINMVEAGEASGTLPLVLIKLADFQEGQVRLKGKVTSAMTYPALMMIVSCALMIGIFTFVMPKISEIFVSMNKPLPIQTQVLMTISSILVNYWYILLSAVVFGTMFFLKFISTPSGRKSWDGFLLKAPLLGPLVRMIGVARFANSMSTLMAGGVPILTAMNIVKNIVGNVHITEAIMRARENVTEGQGIAEPLKRSGQFPPLVIHMIAIGEKTGELPQMLLNVSTTYEEQVTAKINGLTSLIEPIMIIGMGLVVGVIVISVFMPLMQLNDIH